MTQQVSIQELLDKIKSSSSRKEEENPFADFVRDFSSNPKPASPSPFGSGIPPSPFGSTPFGSTPGTPFRSPPAPIGPEIPVEPFPSQIQNIRNHMNILSRSMFSIDNSLMGAGKTPMTIAVKQQINLPFFMVVSPASIEDTWRKTSARYNTHLNYIFSYEGLAVRKGRDPNLMVYRVDETTDKGLVVTTYYPTDFFKSLVEKGILLVFDEFHKIKNSSSDNHRASRALINYICTTESNSRIMFLSASPFDDDKQIIDFLRAVNIIQSRTLYLSDEGRIVLTGAKHLLEYCNDIDPEATKEVLSEGSFAIASEIVKTCAKLYYGVVAKHLSTAAPVPDKMEGIILDCKNCYFNISKEREVLLSQAVRRLHQAARYNDRTQTAEIKEADWGAITRALIAIEMQKVEIFVRIANEVLSQSPNVKVCIMVNFNKPLEITRSLLSRWNPLVLNGKIPKHKRSLITDNFQEHNTNHRLLIANIVVASLGIDLDDTDGNFPRYFLISPNYRAMVLHQATHRPYRARTKSSAVVRFVFGNAGVVETSILNALARRRDVMKASVPKQLENEDDVKFPGEYPVIVEPEGNVEYFPYDDEADFNETEEREDMGSPERTTRP
jgi:hypothetical protein